MLIISNYFPFLCFFSPFVSPKERSVNERKKCCKLSLRVDLKSLVSSFVLASGVKREIYVWRTSTSIKVQKKKENVTIVTLLCPPKEKYDGYIEKNIHCAGFKNDQLLTCRLQNHLRSTCDDNCMMVKPLYSILKVNMFAFKLSCHCSKDENTL